MKVSEAIKIAYFRAQDQAHTRVKAASCKLDEYCTSVRNQKKKGVEGPLCGGGGAARRERQSAKARVS